MTSYQNQTLELTKASVFATTTFTQMLCKKMVFAGRPPRPASRMVLAMAAGRLRMLLPAFSSSLPGTRNGSSSWVWMGGYEVLRAIDKERWNVTMISPNNYFNLRRCSPAVRRHSGISVRHRTGRVSGMVRSYWPLSSQLSLSVDASHASLSFETKSAPKADATTTQFPGTGTPFTSPFDVPGVKEHAHFLKDVKDARAIRTRILECGSAYGLSLFIDDRTDLWGPLGFEQSNQPTISDLERRKLLNFCIVGPSAYHLSPDMYMSSGGPTGVEFAAELHDLLHTEMERHYPGLTRFAKISMYDVAPHILGTFDESLVKCVVSR
ncbi:mitochondrial external NADH dehydrogenase, NDE [Salix suchowensis]|nr:mitochondrial external NADH dehydrogenase, NDE [Salix suchowensis]